MEKVKVTQEQAKDIDDFVRTYTGLEIDVTVPLMVLADAIKYGYEVEPEFKVGDWIFLEKHGSDINTSKVIGFKEKVVNEEVINLLVLDSSYTNFYSKDVQRTINIKSEFLRHATPSEIKQEKERRWWSRHGRERYQFKSGDLIYIPYIHNMIAGFYQVFTTLSGIVLVKNESEGSFDLDGIDLSKIKVVAFVENRLDVKTNG